ncbi:hypothetical protein [Selenihalanaerobacter shriftii]|uniref:Porin n=1 Tax=Selenihalanaerobacter shriftii TaxID=142842 RepID=A0A1T4JTZ2_9FIRM|nr:hypothetical protein [Selenihalanaerobacter shriftii]SJZ33603.1 hypothetical protein SAMN02745118_00406 [Selenihalanaerobacter shriftii]
MSKRVMVGVLVLLMTLVFSTNILAAESAFDEGNSSSTEESSFSDAGFESSFGENSNSFGSSSTWDIGGTIELDYRDFIHEDDTDKSAALELDLGYEAANYDFEGKFNFSDDGDASDIVEEAFVRFYYDTHEIELGKKKVVWGKGDKLHVVDNLNGEDLIDFVNQDYLDRKLGEEMIKLNYYLGLGTLEVVYTPEFGPNQIPNEGDWVTSDMAGMMVLKSTLIKSPFATESQVKEAVEMPEYNDSDDGQFGIRYTNSKSGYDYGVSYYHGRLRTPSMNNQAIAAIKQELMSPTVDSANTIQVQLKEIDPHYDEVDVFGTEFSSVIAGINSRAELAYYLTDDTDGDNPEVHNNKIAWLIGGDRDLPLHNINVNAQLKSELILDDDKIEDNPLDIEYDEDGDYFTNMLVFKVSDSFKYETILPEVSFVYNLEDHDYMLNNEIEFVVEDNTSITFNYKIFNGDEDTTFGQFDNNDYAELNLSHDF